MTTTTAHKRLDEIETHLTPKEWAIRLADEMREISRRAGAHKSAGQICPCTNCRCNDRIYAFEKQAAERIPATSRKTSAPDIG